MIRRHLLLVAISTLLPTALVAQELAPGNPTESPGNPTESPGKPAESPGKATESPGKAGSAAEVPGRALAVPGCTADVPGACVDDPDTTLERYRSPVEVLNERMLGTASRAVRFDWRKTTLGVAAQFSELLERNNFGSTRVGGHVRMPLGGFLIGELGLNYVFNWGSDSTEKLALTPYRQAGRPSRLELDVNVAFPVAEGVATAWPGFFPATELVFSALGGLRYAYYPGAFDGAKATQVGKAILSPQLSDLELANLERRRPGGMQIDPSRYALLVGLSLDVYFQTGGFISPRALISIPLFSLIDDGRLGTWWELSIAAGWAF